jgi:hypothetical protein
MHPVSSAQKAARFREVHMDKVMVFRFHIWDDAIGENTWAPRMASLDAIRRFNGVADLKSALLVDIATLDGNEFYAVGAPRGELTRSATR